VAVLIGPSMNFLQKPNLDFSKITFGRSSIGGGSNLPIPPGTDLTTGQAAVQSNNR
jgi:hypothetical protein